MSTCEAWYAKTYRQSLEHTGCVFVQAPNSTRPSVKLEIKKKKKNNRNRFLQEKSTSSVKAFGSSSS